MNKLLALILLSISIQISFAKDYVLVGVSGFGTRRPENAWQPSGAHENLPRSGNIIQRFELVHGATRAEMNEVLDVFDCKRGKSLNKDQGLIIMVNSWGAGKAHQLAKDYQKRCGKKVDAYYIIDGINKPIGAFGKTPIASQCINYYQTKGMIRGKAIKGCTNYNLTNECGSSGAIECHIHIEWLGSDLAAEHMQLNFL